MIARGVAFKIGRLSAVAWLGQRNGTAPLRLALIALVAVLMVLNSIGVFGASFDKRRPHPSPRQRVPRYVLSLVCERGRALEKFCRFCFEGDHKQSCNGRKMTKLILSAAFGGALALLLTVSTGVALPISLGAEATIESAATLSTIEQVHGTHRSCRLGRVWQWGGAVRWHRHVGSRHTPVRC